MVWIGRMLRGAAVGIVAAATALLLVGASGASGRSTGFTGPEGDARWEWPVAGASVERPFVAPAHRYGAGHRGVDLDAAVGAVVVAPADGVVVFRGRVVDRGVLTLDVGGGVIVSVEPIASELSPGDAVARGAPIGVVDIGGHALPGRLHLGVRVDGEYVDPMRFFGGVARAVLLPCC